MKEITNIEIKAKCEDHNKIREILINKKAKFIGTDHQTDTYFKVNNGRLKLRKGNIENNLIHYYRENITGPKQAQVLLYRSNPGSALKDILVKSLGILCVVDKKREIYFIGNVKFHIDLVRDLGSFIEIEAIDEKGTFSKDSLLEQCNKFLTLFGIYEADLVSDSYSDAILRKGK